MNGLLRDLSVDSPHLLWLLPLALLPFILRPRRQSDWPWLGSVGTDPFSEMVDWGLRILGCVALLALVLCMAGLHLKGGTVQKIGAGAHLVLLIDRSSSMNSSFAGRMPTGQEESKAAAAKRLLKGFVDEREQDRIGMVAFSTMPLFVLPLSDKPDAVNAAIDAIDRPGLSYTDIGRGLAMALSAFDNDNDPLASRVILLVSDGAAVIDMRVQNALKKAVAARPVRLYWLFLRTAGAAGIWDAPADPSEDTPQAMPERHLDIFFKSLGINYRAFEAENAQEVGAAIAEIDKREKAPLRYTEHIPRRELSGYLSALAAAVLLLLLAVHCAQKVVSTGSIRSRHGRQSKLTA
ncbi:vWA domain-containing protein [Advenella kashmirensis]|uniref:vWA domain-containing protein n=1 Tax=Advenella kashmirensis TaxID=310575 RepID=UPI00041D05FA|nr:vWA domain-containing protein [Advenella kashmirensis]